MSHNLYDETAFFEGYSQLPRSREGLSAAPEWPTLRGMLPPLAGQRILDLGCGFGAFCRWAAEAGAERVLGIDQSRNMLARAVSETRHPRVCFRRCTIEGLDDLPDAPFDLVFSALALHYVADFWAVCGSIKRQLAPAGKLVFSVEHPIFTAPWRPGWVAGAEGGKAWPLTGYLVEGPRTTTWITPGVVKYHRTLATHVNTLIGQGFRLDRLEEWRPSAQDIAARPDLADEVQRPMFLLVAAGL